MRATSRACVCDTRISNNQGIQYSCRHTSFMKAGARESGGSCLSQRSPKATRWDMATVKATMSAASVMHDLKPRASKGHIHEDCMSEVGSASCIQHLTQGRLSHTMPDITCIPAYTTCTEDGVDLMFKSSTFQIFFEPLLRLSQSPKLAECECFNACIGVNRQSSPP